MLDFQARRVSKMALKNSCRTPFRPLLMAFWCLPLLAQGSGYLTLGALPQVAAKRGAVVQAKIPCVVQRGFHVNSDKPADEYLIPLRLTWKSTGALEGGT